MYESISLHDLREIAKNRGMRRISALKKADLIDAMLKKDEEEAKAYREERQQRRQELKRQQKEAEEAAAAEKMTAGSSRTGADPQATGSGNSDGNSAQGGDAGLAAGGAESSDSFSRDSRESGDSRNPYGQSGQNMQSSRNMSAGQDRNVSQDRSAVQDAGQSQGSSQPQGNMQSQGNAQSQDNNQSQGRLRSQGQRVKTNTGSYSANGRRQNGRPRQVVVAGGRQQGRQMRQSQGGQREGEAFDSAVRGAERSEPVVREASASYNYTQQPARQSDSGQNGIWQSQQSQSQQSQTGQAALGQTASGQAFSGQAAGQTQEPRNGQDMQQDPQGNRPARYFQSGRQDAPVFHRDELNTELDSGQMANGILEVMQDGFGFIRCANYMPGENDIYVAPSQIRRFGLKTGDIISGNIRVKTQGEKFSALLYVKSVNGYSPDEATKRYNFEDMTPVFPDERIRLERTGGSISMRIMDLMCPVGKGQRGMIVSPPKAGKTTLIKDVARSVKYNNPEIHLIVLLIDERPEEVTDIREAIEGDDAEVIYSTFDELPEHHKRVSEMAIERARRLVEHKRDVMILLDSITRLTRAYNITEPPSGRTLSGGLDPAALHMPKRFFGAARSMREGGSLTILATALIDTGSKMDDIVFEEFKGTGNMELVLDRRLSERRIFPAIDIVRSGTRRDDLLLTPDELAAVNTIRRAFNGLSAEQAVTQALDLFSRTRTNGEFVNMVRKIQWGKE
ncbi:MAG: transcription termination factor Rho [Sarcina sp.]|nr:transcription termination factor Rho [Sarcina sp.]